MSASKLFQPLKLGNENITLNHRVVMAPLTRYRSSAEHVHGDLPGEFSALDAILVIDFLTPNL